MQTDPHRDTMTRRDAHSAPHSSEDHIHSRPAAKDVGVAATGTPRSSTLRTLIALVVVVAAGAAVVSSATAPDVEDVPAVVSIEADGLRYEYHVLSGTAYLWELSAPERDRLNRIRDLPDDAARLRRALERRLRVDDLEILHEPHRATAAHLRELGYL